MEGLGARLPLALARCECLLRSQHKLLQKSNAGPVWPISGDTCLHCAAFFGDAELALMLLSHGAKASVENFSSKMAIARRQADSAMLSAQRSSASVDAPHRGHSELKLGAAA